MCTQFWYFAVNGLCSSEDNKKFVAHIGDQQSHVEADDITTLEKGEIISQTKKMKTSIFTADYSTNYIFCINGKWVRKH